MQLFSPHRQRRIVGGVGIDFLVGLQYLCPRDLPPHIVRSNARLKSIMTGQGLEFHCPMAKVATRSFCVAELTTYPSFEAGLGHCSQCRLEKKSRLAQCNQCDVEGKLRKLGQSLQPVQVG